MPLTLGVGDGSQIHDSADGTRDDEIARRESCSVGCPPPRLLRTATAIPIFALLHFAMISQSPYGYHSRFFHERYVITGLANRAAARFPQARPQAGPVTITSE